MTSQRPIPPSTAVHGEARRIVAAIPALPSHIRYLDEYEDEWRSILRPVENDAWRVVFDTESAVFDFRQFDDPDVRILLKHFAAWLLLNGSVTGAVQVFRGVNQIRSDHRTGWFLEAIERPLFDWRDYWDTQLRATANQRQALAVKLFLRFMCDMCIGAFRPIHADFVRSLPYKWGDNYLGVISGESLLAADQEAAIVAHIDDVAGMAATGQAHLSDKALATACLLCLSYQYGLRPIQIVRINLDDLRIYHADDGPMVHVLAYRAKKRNASEKTSFLCKIKREWAPLFVEYYRRRQAGPIWKESNKASKRKLFPMRRVAVILAIADLTEELTGTRRTATDLRHAAAQRMADSGATLEEVAAFLGHSYTHTSLIYFASSPAQAEKLNRALAISPIYSAIHRVAETRTVDKNSLFNLPADKQIAAVPHGVPVAGIGACDLGQSLCAKNPVLSCYTCSKFLPLADAQVHRDVLDKLRPVVRFFFDESLGDSHSPAYVQLRVTLEQIQSVILSLESGHDE